MNGSRSLLNYVNWIVLMENSSCSSGNFSQDTQHCSYFGKSMERWRKTQFSLNSSEIESSSCRCTLTLMAERQETKTLECQLFTCCGVHKKNDFLKDMGHSSRQEPKKSGTERTLTRQTVWNHAGDLMMMNLRESGHPKFRGRSAWARGLFQTQRRRKKVDTRQR